MRWGLVCVRMSMHMHNKTKQAVRSSVSVRTRVHMHNRQHQSNVMIWVQGK